MTTNPFSSRLQSSSTSGLQVQLRRRTQGDTIRDETSGTFTTHYDGFGWYGTLKTLRAGRMYVVTSAEKGKINYAREGECI